LNTAPPGLQGRLETLAVGPDGRFGLGVITAFAAFGEQSAELLRRRRPGLQRLHGRGRIECRLTLEHLANGLSPATDILHQFMPLLLRCLRSNGYLNGQHDRRGGANHLMQKNHFCSSGWMKKDSPDAQYKSCISM
jgi:hypothetical protein